MNKKISLIIVCLVFLVVIVGGHFLSNNDSETKTLSDALKFKEAYESLNNTIREKDGANYNNVSIPEDNPFKYISAIEATDIIKNKTGIIYFGANWCPWCRSAAEVLINSSNEKKLDTIYYVDIDSVKNTWEAQNGKLIKIREEQNGYYDLLLALDSELGADTYKIKDGNGNEYDTGEKRIYMPFVIAVKNGNIVARKLGTITLEDGQTKYDKLTSKQHEELLNTYNKMIDSINGDDSCFFDDVCN